MHYLVIYLYLSKNIFNGKLTKLTKEKDHDYVTLIFRVKILTDDNPYKKNSRKITRLLLWGNKEEAVAMTAIRSDMRKIKLVYRRTQESLQ